VRLAREASLLSLALALACALTQRADGQCQRAKLLDASGVSGDLFGYATAASGNVAVVGAVLDDEAWQNSGSVSLFERNRWRWSAGVKITPADGGGTFGRSLGIDADTLAVAASGAARVYMFARVADTWVEGTSLTPSDGQTDNFFGWSVAITGDLIVVGAPEDDDRGYGAGAVYVFPRDGDGPWSQAAKLLASDGQGGDHFGISVALDGETVVVGAWDDDDLGFSSGSAYVFEPRPAGGWSQAAKLLASDGGPLERFGVSVAIQGDTVIVASSDAQGPLDDYTGAAYVYRRDQSGLWSETQKLTAADGLTGDHLGWSIALDGGLCVIGAWGDDHSGANQAGSAYVFVPDGSGTWSQVAKLVADDYQAGDEFGYSVALSGNTAVIGAPFDDDNGTDSGSAYVFAVGPDLNANGVMDACECLAMGDLDLDGVVGLTDLAILLADYGCTASNCPADLDSDGDTDLSDLALLLANYGTECP